MSASIEKITPASVAKRYSITERRAESWITAMRKAGAVVVDGKASFAKWSAVDAWLERGGRAQASQQSEAR